MAVCRQNGHVRRTRFQQLWLMVEAMVVEKRQLEVALDSLALRMEAEILPAELALAKLCRQALERLLLFSERRTLSKRRREALAPWMDELLDTLLDAGCMDNALRDRLARHHARVLELSLDAQSPLSDWCQLSRYLEEREACEDRFRQEFLRATESCPEQPETHHQEHGSDWQEDFEPSPRQHQSSARAEGDATGYLDDAVFKRLFRQTAAALHPDKETDEGKQRDKHVLMTKLLQARKEHDLLTLMQLHERYAENRSALSQADERQLEGVLLQHLLVLQKQKEALAEKSFLHYMAYHQFHDKDSRVVDARFADHLAFYAQRQASLAAFLDEVKTLKQLQERLPMGYDYLRSLW